MTTELIAAVVAPGRTVWAPDQADTETVMTRDGNFVEVPRHRPFSPGETVMLPASEARRLQLAGHLVAAVEQPAPVTSEEAVEQ